MMRCKMKNIPYFLHYATMILIILLVLGVASPSPTESTKKISNVDVGLVVDVSRKSGMMLKSFIEMAHSDFYVSYPSYTTRLALRTNYTTNSIDAPSAVVELLKDEVKAILGPKSLVQAKFVVELGEKSHVPIISFDEASYSGLHIQSPYLIANVVSFNASFAPVIALFKEFQWREVAFICEDVMYDTDVFPSLINSFQKIGVRISYMSVISHTSRNDLQILDELHKLDELQTKIFLVYMRPKLGSRFFGHAKALKMMREGYAWIITDALANSLHSIDPNLIKSLDGVVGIRPHVPLSRNLENFRRRWQEHSHMMNAGRITTHELIVYGSWAYDIIWALATSIERIGNEELSFVKANNNKNGGEISQLGMSRVGHLLLKEITNPRTRGLNEKLFMSREERDILKSYEIINLDGGERIVGYWTPDKGISRELDSNDTSKNSSSVEELKKIIWPGDTTIRPYWVPQKGKELRVGVPKKMGFTQFVKVEKNNDTNEFNVTGFCIDLFEGALKLLPFQVVPKYIPFMNSSGQSSGTYDDLLNQLQTKEMDAVVGDTTILSYRTHLMDFTLPYTEPGIVMLVPIKDDKLKGIWVFIKPLKWDLWCTIAGTCLFVGLAIRILERKGNPPWKVGLFFCFPILILAFPERKIVSNKWSRVLLVIWLFMAYIIMQGYTASLSAILTIEQIQPSRIDCVGYNGGSYAKEILMEKLKYSESQLRPYQTMEAYHLALKKGCQNDGVDAIFDDIPNIRLFLHKYGPKYVTVGRKHRTNGFGFAFPLGSPLVEYMSKAIVNFTQSDSMKELKDAYFGPNYSSDQDFNPQIAREAPGLNVYNFAGLFIIIVVATIVALLCSETTFLQKCALNVKNHERKQGSSFSSTQIAAVDDDNDDDIVSINGVSTNVILTTHNNGGDVIEHRLAHVDAVAHSRHEEVELTIRHN